MQTVKALTLSKHPHASLLQQTLVVRSNDYEEHAKRQLAFFASSSPSLTKSVDTPKASVRVRGEQVHTCYRQAARVVTAE